MKVRKKPRMGRPPKPPAERRSVVALRLTPPELATIKRAARSGKVPVSVYIRDAALDAARRTR